MARDEKTPGSAGEPSGSWMPPEAEPESPPPEPESPEPETPSPEPDAASSETRAPQPEADQLRAAALAYCATVLDAPADAEATDDAIAALGDPLESPELLLAVTRLMAAVSLPDASSPADRRAAVRTSVGAESRCTCREAPILLATRANGTADERGTRALELHLQDCEACRALEERLARADAAFRQALPGGRPVSPEADPPR